MKKLFMVLCIAMMFSGIVGCPSYDPESQAFKSSYSSTTVTPSEEPVGGPDVSPVPEPAALMLFGTGLVGLAGLERKKLKK